MPMKALILVGGFGTRLRPLTFTKPKPLVEFCNSAIVEHQVRALVEVGVDEVVLAVNYKPDLMRVSLEAMETKYGITVCCSQETEPLGTAGPLALARKHLKSADGSPFFVFNSDVICDYPLRAMLDFHTAHGKEGTILVKRVEDPSKYGVVVAGVDGKIDRFVEKPQKFVGDCINAGLYIFSPPVLDRIELRPTSIEREIFPSMAAEQQLYCMTLNGYWMDIGQPKDYLSGMCMHIDSVATKHKSAGNRDAAGGAGAGADVAAEAGSDESKSDQLTGNKCIIHPTATVAPDAVLGPHVVVGAGCVVESGARIVRSALLDGSTVKAHAYVHSTIVGWNSSIGRWARSENVTVLGECVEVKDAVCLNGVRVLPHKAVKDSQFVEGTIIM